MKITSYTLAKKEFLLKLQNKASQQENQISSATAFVKEIEKGNLDVSYHNQDEQEDGLAASLISMRNQMKKFSQEEKERNWATEGLAKFVDILRSKNENLSELSENIVSNLVRYMKANQGALYLINDENSKDVHIEMAACYAYNRKKYMNQRIELGQGLTGQVVLEKDVLYLTDIPTNYLKITSGLGEALPRNLLMVPLQLEDRIYGVVEIASFDKIKPYQIEFVKKLGESIASTISSVRVNERTKKLLVETQQQAEQMRSQEEEMRQNMEELSATQEEMQRILKEVQGQESYMNELINSSSDSILVVDREYKVMSANRALQKSYAGLGFDVVKGFDAFKLFSDAERPKYKSYYDRTLGGEGFQLTEHYQSHGFDTYFLIQYTPIRNAQGDVTAAAVFAKDISDMIKAQKAAETLAHESQQRNEELKAQEEELRQNMEELSATQDEMQRVLVEVQSKEGYLNEILNAAKDAIFTLDKDFKVISFNKSFTTGLEAIGIKVEKGFDMLSIYAQDKKEWDNQHSYYTKAFSGETFERTDRSEFNGIEQYYAMSYSPLKRESGEVFAIAVFAKDVTEIYSARKAAETLAHESQQRNEELKAQEEELRQNMEELSATQDEMQRILHEVQRSEQDITELINVSGDSILTMDRDFKVLRFNKVFSSTFESKGMSVGKGFDILQIFNDEEKKRKADIYNRVFAGERLELLDHLDTGGFDNYFNVTHSPIRDAQGEINSIAVFAKDITEMYNAKKTANALVQESQQRNEELKAQEEELRQNMEELSATQEEMERILLEVQAKEGYLNEVINAAKDSIFTLDADFKVISANNAFTVTLEGLGMKVDKGFDMLSIFQHDKKEQNKQRAYYKRALGGETFEVTDRSEMNGIVSYYNVNYSPLKKEDGKVFAIAVFAKDVTEVMKAKELTEELLQKANNQQAYFNDVINGLGDSVLTIDREFRIVIANDTFKKVFSRYGVSTNPGDSLLTMAKKEELEAFKKPYLRAFKGEVVEVPHRHHFDRDFHVYYNPLKDSSGKIIGVSLIAHDITKRLEIQRKGEELLKESQDKFKKKEEEYKQRIAALEKRVGKASVA